MTFRELFDTVRSVEWTFGSSTITLGRLFEGGITAAVVMGLAFWIAAIIERKLIRGTGSDLSLRKMVANLTRALLLAVGLFIALSAVGIDLTALSVLGGALGVGLGFGLQRIAANYVSGLVMLAERAVRVGDMVKIDGFEGRVSDIRTRYTVVRAVNGRESIVPNEMFISQRVENHSFADTVIAVTSTVQVAYGTDIEALRPRLLALMSALPRVLPSPGPAVQVASFGAAGIELTFVVWIADPENGQGNIRSDVNSAALALFKAEGVEMPIQPWAFDRRSADTLPTSGSVLS